MSTTYTQLLWRTSVPSAGITNGPVVPAGQLWVLRDVNAHYSVLSGGFFPGFFLLQDQSAGVGLWGVGTVDAVAGRVFHDELRQALSAGNGLQVNCKQGGWVVSVTGYVFTSP